MLKPQKKISKREIKQDPLITWYFEARQWFESRKKILSYVGLAVVALIVGGWVYMNNRTQAEQNASAGLGKVLRYYDQGQFELAINGIPQENIRGLQSIVDEYDGTASGEQAQFYLANAYYNQKQYDKALENFDGTDLDDPTLVASVRAGQGACHEALAQFEEAGSSFEEASGIASDEILAPEYLFHAARNFIKSGDRARAESLLTKLKKDHPMSAFAREVDKLLAELNT